MQVVIQDTLTAYERTGSGRQLLILPGWADTSVSWQAFATQLATTYEVITLNLPGFGGTDTPKGVWGLDDYASFVQAFVAKLGLEIYGVIGHSNGGAVAIRSLALGDLHPEKLVLLASAGIRGEGSAKKQAIQIITKAGKLLAKPLPQRLQTRLRKKLYTGIGSDLLVAEHMSATFKRIVADDVRGSAAAVTVPTLLVYGDSDDQTPARHGELLQECILGSRLEIIAGAGHFLHLDKPVELQARTREFLV